MKKVLMMIVLVSCIFVGCGKSKEKPVRIGQTFVSGSLNPTAGGTPWALTSQGLSETIYRLDSNGELSSRFVSKIDKIDELTWNITLKKGVKFSDGSEVNAKSLAWAMNTIMKENKLSHATGGVVVFTPESDYTVKLVSERRIGNLKAFFTEWTNVIFKKGDKGYIFTGPYVVKTFDPGVSIDMLPNKYYPNTEKRGEVIIKSFKDISALKLAFESGDLDLAFGLTPEIAQQLKDAGKIVEKINAGYQYFGILEMSDPLRQAVNVGLNRADYIKALKGGRIANGLFAHYFPFAGGIDVKYDPKEANEILDNAGYVMENGVRTKDGEPLKLSLITYNSRPDLKIIMQVMVSQLKNMGIETTTKIVDNIDSAIRKEHYDIILYAQNTAPTGDPVYFLNQFFRTDGPKNVEKYSSPVVDNLLNELDVAQGQEADKIAKEIQVDIYKDAPVLYLVDPEWNVALSERLKNYKIYNGDYYIVNSKLFVK